MPRENRRSTRVYRKLAFCTADPSDVVQYCRSTVKKPKAIPPAYQKETVNSTAGLGIRELPAAQSPTTFHISDVSRGAHKLNTTVLNSCSNDNDGYNNINHIDLARDSLNGLTMLCKLQEEYPDYYLSSRSTMKQFDRKMVHRGGNVVDHLELPLLGKRNLCNRKDGFLKKDPLEELKREIGYGTKKDPLEEEFNREIEYGNHNLLQEDDYDADRATRVTGSDHLPSTSSSQTSGFLSPESSLSSTASQQNKNKEKKSLNLVAKLMGLEDGFLRSSPSSSPRRRRLLLVEGNKKIVNQRKPTLDLDSPRAISPELLESMNTLDEVIEAVKLKGLLKTNNLMIKSPMAIPSISDNQQRSCGNDTPPIVIIKPILKYYSPLPITPRPQDRDDLDYLEEIVLKLGEERESLASVSCSQLRGSLNSDKKAKGISMVEVGMMKNHIAKEVGMIKNQVAKEGYHQGPVRGKLQTKSKEKASSARTNALQTEAKWKPIVSAPRKVLLASSPRKGVEYGCTNLKMKKPESRTKVSEVQNASINGETKHSRIWRRNLLKKDHEVCKDLVRIHVNWLYEDESQSHSLVGDNEPILQISDVLVDKFAEEKINEIKDYVNDEYSSLCKEKPSRLGQGVDRTDEVSSSESENSSLTMTSLGEEGFANRQVCKNIYCDSEIIAKEKNPGVEEETASQHQNAGLSDRNIKEAITDVSSTACASSETGSREVVDEWKSIIMLSSSPPFIHRVKELFNLQFGPAERRAIQASNPDEVADSRLLLDCASELIEVYGSWHLPQIFHLENKYNNKLANNITCLDHVLDLVCNGINELRSAKKDVGSISTDDKEEDDDDLLLLVQRDLWCKGVTSGIWNVGWRSTSNGGGSMDEVEEFVGHLEWLMLGKLMEEIIVDFACY